MSVVPEFWSFHFKESIRFDEIVKPVLHFNDTFIVSAFCD